MKNYRPIFNPPFISKLNEKVVARCVEEHLNHSDPNDSYQSAYGRGNSTETAFLKVHSDIAGALYKGSMTSLIIFNSYTASDVIIRYY